MKDQLEERLKGLQGEYEAGQKMLAELDARRQNLTSTLLRIEGAMQVLREVLGQGASSPEEPVRTRQAS
jgi:predicted nuclease with TOPRIM domain